MKEGSEVGVAEKESTAHDGSKGILELSEGRSSVSEVGITFNEMANGRGSVGSPKEIDESEMASYVEEAGGGTDGGRREGAMVSAGNVKIASKRAILSRTRGRKQGVMRRRKE